MILILTEPRDVHADHVARKLEQRGAEFRRFHHDQFPAHAEISLWYSATGRVRHLLHEDEGRIDLDRVETVWYRRSRSPVLPEGITDEAGRALVEGECQDLLHDTWNTLDCRWLPAPEAVIRRATLKATQLKVAGVLGFEIPPTLITNSPADLLEFYRAHDGQILSKLPGFSFFRSDDPPSCRFTERVSQRDVEHAHAIRSCPAIYQAEVPRRIELCIAVVGLEVFAVEVPTGASNHPRHGRRPDDDDPLPHRPHELPRAVWRRCVQLVRQLGLCYGVIDMVLTPDGRYVFIEINPNGQFLWLERASGLPISDAICDLLMAGHPGDEPAVRVDASATAGARS